MNQKTFIVLFFLALPLRLVELGNSKLSSATGVGIAIVVAALIAVVWSIIAAWLRMKFANNLSEEYIKKIQIIFLLIGVVLTVASIVNL